jgi:PAS domain S-box-containing protein
MLVVLLALAFTRGVGRRFLTLTQNAQRLAAGRQLAARMSGDDEIARLDHVFHDMADALTEAARKERALVDNALDVICSIDAEGRFVRVSASCLKLWGYTPDELMGRPYIELVAPQDREITNGVAQEIMAGKAVTDFVNHYTHKDGSIVAVTWSASWSEADHMMFAVARDVTERERTEQEIKQLNESLTAYAARLEAANAELESFSYSVSHDLQVETAGRNITWSVEANLPDARGDPEMLRLVMTNLMSNAVKYTRTRPEARIEIGSSNGRSGQKAWHSTHSACRLAPNSCPPSTALPFTSFWQTIRCPPLTASPPLRSRGSDAPRCLSSSCPGRSARRWRSRP